MAEHDEQDPDREAIMARRRRFIAVALGGLATGCPSRSVPDPSTSGTNGPTTNIESGESGGGSGSETAPQACLKLDLPPSSESESESGIEETETSPRPCLVPPESR
jgi:hypothetical protein